MDPANLSTKCQWIADLARNKPGQKLFLLHHVIDHEWMREAYRLTRKDGAGQRVQVDARLTRASE
jgi:RNA-directed DNA polymerase